MRSSTILVALALLTVPLLAAAPASAGTPLDSVFREGVASLGQVTKTLRPSTAGGVSCTALAPVSIRCGAVLPPSAANGGVLALDLGALAQKTPALVELVSPDAGTVWSCVVDVDALDACNGALPAASGHTLVVSLEEGAAGKWGWTWSPS